MLARLIEKHEGRRLTVYRCPAGKLTIGVGRNLEDRGITDEEAGYLLRNDLARVEAELDDRLPWWRDTHINDARRAVLADMAFNLGTAGLLKFRKFLAAYRLGDWGEAAWQMRAARWWKQVGDRAPRLEAMVLHGDWPADI